MSNPTRVGVIGAGNISSTYFRLAPQFRDIDIVAVADLDMSAAAARAREFNIAAMSVEALLGDRSIGIIVNLTSPAAHLAVSTACLEAGKHVYSEKPFVLTLEDGLALKSLAEARGLVVASAPDTFLGGAHQTARRLVDEQRIGRVLSGSAYVMSHGMEHWHPNPDFFFKPGGGPMLDMGPYYLHNLIQLLGPVARVAALSGIGSPLRTISSRPRAGETITVETPTSYLALLEFASGAHVQLAASWDVWAHRHASMELYGETGSLYLPDPNFFGGKVLVTSRDGKPSPAGHRGHPLSIENETHGNGKQANHRTIGLADLAVAIRDKRPARCSIDLALHAVEVMTAIATSGERRSFITLSTTCERPAPLGPAEARTFLRDA